MMLIFSEETVKLDVILLVIHLFASFAFSQRHYLAMENNFLTNHCQRQHSMQFESEDPKRITYAIQLMLLKRRLGAL